MFFCGVVLFFDVGGELHAAYLYPQSMPWFLWAHLGMEAAASMGLGLAFILLRRQTRNAASETAKERHRLHTLRSDFDSFIYRRFHKWGLSKAEADIALLTLRGLKISEIALARDTREGTIKSQLSSIFRKSDVHSRTAFVAQFIDEFLDIGASANETAKASAPTDPASH